MKKQGKKINGILDIDSPDMERMRQIVIEQELSARSHKAFYEKMYYALEAEKIEPLYQEYVERRQKRLEEEKAKMEQFKKDLAEAIRKQNEADPNGNTELKEVES